MWDGESSDHAGQRLLGLVACLLRPMVRPAPAPGGSGGVGSGPPPLFQQGALTLDCGWDDVDLEVTQTFTNVAERPVQVSSAIPLWAGASVRGMQLRHARGSAVAGIWPREEGREEFLRAKGRSATPVLFGENALGVFSQDIGLLRPGLPLTVAVSAACFLGDAGLTEAARYARVTVRFDATPPLCPAALSAISQQSPQPATNRSGDALRYRGCRWEAVGDGTVPSPEPPALRPWSGLLLSCDSSDASRVAFRGMLAGRFARMAVELRRGRGPRRVETRAGGWLEPLMGRYRSAVRECEREKIADVIGRLGLSRHTVTQWTSLLAVAEPPGDPDGELVPAAVAA